MFTQDGYQVTRHICPRNCYDTCSMLAYVRNGRLEKVTGDPLHGYTRGKLCSKGYNYVKRVYSPERLKFPMRQLGRGSGNWQRISWAQAMETISEKILELKDRFGTALPLCLNKYSGNFGVLHYAVEGMFNSLGPTTQARGSPCWSAGLDAQMHDMGASINSDPEDMLKAKLIILWGVNPAWTAVHSMPYIYQARENGARIVVIDPVMTQTARKADWYIQIRPGEDGALALALMKLLRGGNAVDWDFIRCCTTGWPEFDRQLAGECIDELANRCGQDRQVLEELAAWIGNSKPVFIWVGFGMQRHVNGGNNIRQVNALAALTGNIGLPGGGVHYAHPLTGLFQYRFLQDQPENRYLNINEFAFELARTGDPPVKFLWVSCRNLLTQDVCSTLLQEQLKRLEMIITVEQFLTPTAQYSDIVLPAATQFEEVDLVPSYWHYWIALNEQAIQSYYEAKSDLEIARLLTAALNERRQGSSNFPVGLSAEELLEREFSPEAYRKLGISHWSELAGGPRRTTAAVTAWSERSFATASGKYEFMSEQDGAEQSGFGQRLRPGLRPDAKYPYWFITSHAQQGLNSQFHNLESARPQSCWEATVLIHPETAARKGIADGKKVKIFNDLAGVVLRAKVSPDTPPDVLVCHQGWHPDGEYGLNALNGGTLSDMGELSTGARGIAFYDVFVDITPA